MIYDKTISFKVNLEQFDLLHNEAAAMGMDISQLMRYLAEGLKKKEHLVNMLEFHKYQQKQVEDKLSLLKQPIEKKNAAVEANTKIKENAQEVLSEFKRWHSADLDEQGGILKEMTQKFIEFSKTLKQEETLTLINMVNKMMLGLKKDKLNELINSVLRCNTEG